MSVYAFKINVMHTHEKTVWSTNQGIFGNHCKWLVPGTEWTDTIPSAKWPPTITVHQSRCSILERRGVCGSTDPNCWVHVPNCSNGIYACSPFPLPRTVHWTVLVNWRGHLNQAKSVPQKAFEPSQKCPCHAHSQTNNNPSRNLSSHWLPTIATPRTQLLQNNLPLDQS